MTEQEQLAADAAAEEAAKKAREEADAKQAEQDAEAARLAKLSQAERDADMVEKLVKNRISDELKPIKEKLDAAFKQRDEALAKLKEFETKEREATLKKLEEDGKHKEAADMRVAEANATIEALRKQNTELSRDVSVRDALKSYMFRNNKASEMAYKEIISNLVQNEQGQWVHRSGISIRDYCEAFSKDEEQAFLFKAKSNSGAGTSSTTTTTPASNKPKSLFDLPQAEVLKMAGEGKFGNINQIP